MSHLLFLSSLPLPRPVHSQHPISFSVPPLSHRYITIINPTQCSIPPYTHTNRGMQCPYSSLSLLFFFSLSLRRETAEGPWWCVPRGDIAHRSAWSVSAFLCAPTWASLPCSRGSPTTSLGLTWSLTRCRCFTYDAEGSGGQSGRRQDEGEWERRTSEEK